MALQKHNGKLVVGGKWNVLDRSFDQVGGKLLTGTGNCTNCCSACEGCTPNVLLATFSGITPLYNSSDPISYGGVAADPPDCDLSGAPVRKVITLDVNKTYCLVKQPPSDIANNCVYRLVQSPVADVDVRFTPIGSCDPADLGDSFYDTLEIRMTLYPDGWEWSMLVSKGGTFEDGGNGWTGDAGSADVIFEASESSAPDVDVTSICATSPASLTVANVYSDEATLHASGDDHTFLWVGIGGSVTVVGANACP